MSFRAILPVCLLLMLSIASADMFDFFSGLQFDVIKATGDFSPYISGSTCEGSKIFDGAKLDTAEDVQALLDANKCYATAMPKETKNGITFSPGPAIPNQIYSDHMTSCFWADMGVVDSKAPAFTKDSLSFANKQTIVTAASIKLVEKTETGIDTQVTFEKADENGTVTNETVMEKSSMVSFKDVASSSQVMYCFNITLSKDAQGRTILPSSNPFNATIDGKVIG